MLSRATVAPRMGPRGPAAGWLLLPLTLGSIAGIAVAVAGPSAILVAILAMLVAFAAVLAPGVLFAAYLLVPFYKGAAQAYSAVDITLVLALLNAAQIVPVVLGQRRRDISRSGMILWIALALLVLGGVLYSPDQGLALGHTVNYWALVLLPILPAALRVSSDPRFVRQFLWAFFGMGVVVVVMGLSQWPSTDRLVVLGTNTIGVARAALLVPLVGVTFVLLERRRFWRAVTIVLVPAALVVAFAAGSAGPLLALLVLGVILGGLAAVRQMFPPRSMDPRRAALIAGLVLASIAVISVVSAQLPGQSIERFTHLGTFVQGGLSGDPSVSAADPSSGARVTLFGLAFSLFEQQPILGVGTAGFEALSPRYLGPLRADTYPHNAVLQFAAEYGLIGLTLFLSLVILGMTRRLPSDGPWRAVRVLFLFFLLNAMVSGDIFSDRETWGLLLLVLFADVPRIVPQPDLQPVSAPARPVSVEAHGPRPADPQAIT